MKQIIHAEYEIQALRAYTLKLGITEAMLLFTKEELLKVIDLKFDSILEKNNIHDSEYTYLCQYAEEIGAPTYHCAINDKGCVRTSIKKHLIYLIDFAQILKINFEDYIQNIIELNKRIQEKNDEINARLNKDNNQNNNNLDYNR